MRVIFCKSGKIGSRLIRAATWSDWSHVGVVVDGQYVIEAVWPEVRPIPLDDFIALHSSYAIVDIPCADETSAIDALLDQIGKPYDLTAILGIGIYRDWQDEDKWFCSELVAWAFEKGGTPLFRAEVMHRITPQHLWMLAPSPPGSRRDENTPLTGRLARP